MSTVSFAVLGATGNVGSQILEALLLDTTTDVHAFCRSKQKLFNQSPKLKGNKRVKVFEGGIDDQETLSACIRGSRAVFLAIAMSGNQPGQTVARDQARAVVNVLEDLQKENQSLPKLVMLSSSSTDHRLLGSMPNFLRNVIYASNSNIYYDLEEAEKFLRSKSFITSTFIKPNVLSSDERKGYSLSFSEAHGPLSYADLGAGMVEIAQDTSDRYDGKSVAVNPVTNQVAIPWYAPPLLIRGLLIHFFPFLWRFIG